MFVYRGLLITPSLQNTDEANESDQNGPEIVFQNGMYPKFSHLGANKENKEWWKDILRKTKTPSEDKCSGVNPLKAVCASSRPEVTPLFPTDYPDSETYLFIIYLPDDPIQIQLDETTAEQNLLLPPNSSPEKEISAIDIHSLQVQQAHNAYKNNPGMIDSAHTGWALFAHEIAIKEVLPEHVVGAIRCQRITSPFEDERKDKSITPEGNISALYGTDFQFVGDIIYNPRCPAPIIVQSKEAASYIEELRDKQKMYTPSVFSGLGGTLLPNPLFDNFRKGGTYAVIMHLVAATKHCIKHSGDNAKEAKAILDLFHVSDLVQKKSRDKLCDKMFVKLQEIIKDAPHSTSEEFQKDSLFYSLIEEYAKISENHIDSKNYTMETLNNILQMMRDEINSPPLHQSKDKDPEEASANSMYSKKLHN